MELCHACGAESATQYRCCMSPRCCNYMIRYFKKHGIISRMGEFDKELFDSCFQITHIWLSYGDAKCWLQPITPLSK